MSDQPDQPDRPEQPGASGQQPRTPGYGTPGRPTPGYGTPGYGTPGQPTPGYGTPGYGTPGQPPPGWGRPPTSSGKAVAVLVLGIVSIVTACFWFVGLILAIVALVIAPGAKKEIRGAGGRLTGEGMVTAGVVCSWITVGFSALALFAWIALSNADGSGPFGW